MEQLKFKETNAAYDSHEDTSIKKYTNKYYDYQDIIQKDPVEPAKINFEVYDNDNNNSLEKLIEKKKKLNSSANCISKTKQSETKNQSYLTIRDKKKFNNSVNLHNVNTKRPNKESLKSNRDNKQNQNPDELKYYKRICADMRKKNEQLEMELKKKNIENQSNIKNLENQLKQLHEQVQEKIQTLNQQKYKELFEHVYNISDKLNKKELKNEKYRKFYGSFVESLELLGVECERKQLKDVWKVWKQVVQFLMVHKFKL